MTTRDLDILGVYSCMGFSLEEPDDHIIILKYEDEEIAKFSQQGASPEALQSQCASHLEEVQKEV